MVFANNAINELIWELIENNNSLYLAQVVYEQIGGLEALIAEGNPDLVHYFIIYENKSDKIDFLTISSEKQLKHQPNYLMVLSFSSEEFLKVFKEKEAKKRFPMDLHNEEVKFIWENDEMAFKDHYMRGCGICQSYEEEFYEKIEEEMVQIIGEKIDDYLNLNPNLCDWLLDSISNL